MLNVAGYAEDPEGHFQFPPFEKETESLESFTRCISREYHRYVKLVHSNLRDQFTPLYVKAPKIIANNRPYLSRFIPA